MRVYIFYTYDQLEIRYLEVLDNADHESESKIQKFRLANEIS